MIRVLIADDSLTTRAQIVRLLRRDPEITVVGEVKDGLAAIAATQRLRPDVVIMDAMMPQLDGLEATKRIMFECPTPVVIMSSSFTRREVSLAFESLRVGAVHAVPKPVGPGFPDFEDEARKFVRMIKTMANVKVVRRRLMGSVPPQSNNADNTIVETPRISPRIMAIAASTGGPAAIHRILSTLPAQFAVPILVVQHISVGFTEDFARWLDASSQLNVKLAVDEESLLPATVYIAPQDRHLGVRHGAIALSSEPPIGGFRPSATYLFESVARSFGATSLAVLLTGMGRDGVDGLRAIHAVNGSIVTQDEATCVVYGMPAMAAEAGVAGKILPINAIAPYLARILE